MGTRKYHIRLIRILSLIALLALSGTTWGQSSPDVFWIGDSISNYYTPYLARDLDGVVSYGFRDGTNSDPDVPTGPNSGTSTMVLEYLKKKYARPEFRPQIFLVNAGLHDIKRGLKANEITVGAEEYRRNLMAIAQMIKQHGAHLIWINTTPVDDARHNRLMRGFHRFNADVIEYNRIAADVFRIQKMPVIDLYSFTLKDAASHYADHVHFDNTERELQAAYIAGSLLALLNDADCRQYVIKKSAPNSHK